jgi:S-adenosylmethionine-diacylgycerolhomoserine-N-methlytransferase
MSDLSSHSQLMNKVYRLQRYIYDPCRKYFLFGRDTLIDRMEIRPGMDVLEVGVGTARNLIMLGKRHPQANLFGIDASTEMLETAAGKVGKSNLASPIQMRYGFAESYHYQKDFQLDSGFDVVFLSYSLSMVSDWKGALDNSLANLKPGGCLYIVDFWDQAGYPTWFQSVLKWWLRRFHVAYKPDFLHYLESKALDDGAKLKLVPIGKRYAFVLSFVKAGAEQGAVTAVA